MRQSDSSEWNKYEQMGSKKSKIYECLCGKKYRTVAAYNTHMKISHNGNSANSFAVEKRRQRGRPKQYQYKQFKDAMDLTKNPLIELVEIGGQYVCVGASTKKIYENELVFKLIKRFCESERDENLRYVQQDKIYFATMGEGIAILLQQLKRQELKEQFYNDIVLLITIYISYVIDQTEDQNVLVNGSIGLLPEFANIFILYDLPERCKKLKVVNSWINDNLKAVKVLSIIFNWLIYKRFTHTTAIINLEYTVDSDKSVPMLDVSVQAVI